MIKFQFKLLLCSLLLCIGESSNSQIFKEVEFNWVSPSTIWSGQAGFVPCGEAFTINVNNCPENTTQVEIEIYESSGQILNSTNLAIAVAKTTTGQTYTAVKKSSGVFSALISARLTFKRFYYIDVKLTTSRTTVTVTHSNSPGPVVITQAPVNSSVNSNISVVRTTTTSTQIVVTPLPTPATIIIDTITTTSVTQDTTQTKSLSGPVYAIPLKSEISTIQFYGAIGDGLFAQKDLKNLDHNIAMATGIQLKFWPVSTNENIGRFGLYPLRSRFSLVFATIITDLSYKSTNLTASFFGLKPVVGVGYEISPNIGITGGAIFANQETGSKLTVSKNISTGFFFGLSFSADVFQAIHNNTPASQNFPTSLGQ